MPAESQFGRTGRSLWGETDWRLQISVVRNGSFRNGMFYGSIIEGAFLNCVLEWASNLSLNKHMHNKNNKTSIGILRRNTQPNESIWQAIKLKARVQRNWCEILAEHLCFLPDEGPHMNIKHDSYILTTRNQTNDAWHIT